MATANPSPNDDQRRKSIPPLTILRGGEDSQKEDLYELLRALNKIDLTDVPLMQESVRLLKLKKSEYHEVSTALSKRTFEAGCLEESRELRASRFQIMTDCHALLKLFNTSIRNLGHEPTHSLSESYVSTLKPAVDELQPTQKISSEKSGAFAGLPPIPKDEDSLASSDPLNQNDFHRSRSVRPKLLKTTAFEKKNPPKSEKKIVHFDDATYEVSEVNGRRVVTQLPRSRSTDSPPWKLPRCKPVYSDWKTDHPPSLPLPSKQKVSSYLKSNANDFHHSTPTPTPQQRSPTLVSRSPLNYDPSKLQQSTYNDNNSNSTSRRISDRLQEKLREDLIFSPKSPYGGESFTFWAWRDRIQQAIHDADLLPLDALYVIQRNTTKRPRSIVDNLIASSASPETTLDIVWETLTSRFGSSHRLAEELFSKIDNFPLIKSLKNQTILLEDLLDLSMLVEANIVNSRELRVLNYPSGIGRFLDKVPEVIHDRWRKHWHSYESATGIEPDFSVFTGFLKEIVGEFSVPITVTYSSRTTKAVRTLRTEVAEAPLTKKSYDNTCALHNSGTHTTAGCYTLQKMPYERVRQLAFEKKLCYRCLCEGHLSNNCKIEVRCGKCPGRHVTTMHPPARKYTDDRQREKPAATTVNLCTSIRRPHSKISSCGKTCLVDIRLIGSDKTFRCFCIIDEQSDGCLIDPSLIKSFGVDPPSTNYSTTTIDGFTSRVKGHVLSGCEVKGYREKQWIRLPKLYSNDNIPDTRYEIATSQIVSAHPHIAHLSHNFLSEVGDYDVLLLIGRNSGPSMATKPYGERAPFAHHTALGWALVGPVCKDNEDSDPNIILRTSICEEPVTVKPLFSTHPKFDVTKERIDDEVIGMSQNDVLFNSIMQNSVVINAKGNLQFDLPLKENARFPDNKSAVYKRTFNTLDRLSKDTNKLDQCLSVMGKYISNGHVKPIDLKELECDPGKVWYLPVFPVTHPKKQSCRLVFDSSASYDGVSLNNNLYQGPDENNLLLGVLMRFRLGEIGFSCDIESMFHCFYVSPQHTNYLRFFWYQNNNPSNPIIPFQALVQIFGNSSSPAVANYALNYAALHSPHPSPQSSRDFIRNSMYVDDGIGSANSPKEAIDTLKGAINLLSHYKIRLHKIISSSLEVTSSFPTSELAEEAKVICASEDGITSTLGIVWNTRKDTLSLRDNLSLKPYTKRGVLSVNGSNFDPLGISAPVSLGGKLFQRMILPPGPSSESGWSDFDWDDPLPIEFEPVWLDWIRGLANLHKLKVPRGYVPLGFGEVIDRKIHMFCDASKNAISYVSYVQSKNSTGHLHNCFLLANSKVSPKMANTIPRLELNAAVEAVLAARKISVELNFPISDIRFYTDSAVLLGYVNNVTKRFKRYVTRRIEQILGHSCSSQWSYVSSNTNPADMGTKPHTPDELLRTRWLTGPEFLWHNSSSEEFLHNSVIDLPEEVTNQKVLKTKIEDCASIASEIGRKTNCLNKSICRMQIFLRLLNNLDRAKMRLGISLAQRTATPSRSMAITKLLSDSQNDCFEDSIEILAKSETLPSKYKIAKCSPFLGPDGLMRVGGRLSRADIPYHLRHPIILPKDHPVTTMILHDVHHKSLHSGRYINHGMLREQGYYVIGGLKSIRSLIENCFLCRTLRGPLQEQLMSELPKDRLEEVPPFTNCGVDVFGPYYYHEGRQTRSTTASRKIWGLLFTCLSCRGVHIEPIFQMDTNCFRNALRRFCAIRGTCRKIRSDRGTNFLGARNQMEEVDLDSIQKFANSNNIEWEFTTAGASSQGGVWERKVGSIKNAMSASLRQLNKRVLSRDEIVTLFQEACSVVNNTPLFEFSSMPDDALPISPSMLLTLKERPNPPDLESFSESDLLQYGAKRWRRVQYLAEQFWCHWRKHYIQTLQLRSKWLHPKRTISIGDIVLLKENGKRNNWPICRVDDLVRSKDGLVRSVVLKLPGSKPRYLTRPLFHTVLLIPGGDGEVGGSVAAAT